MFGCRFTAEVFLLAPGFRLTRRVGDDDDDDDDDWIGLDWKRSWFIFGGCVVYLTCGKGRVTIAR